MLDIKAALRVDVGTPTSSDNGSVTTCNFATADKSTIVSLVRHEPVGDLLKNVLAADPDAKAFPGIIDEAVLQIKIGQITVRKGKVGFAISVMPVPTQEALVQLARQSAGKA